MVYIKLKATASHSIWISREWHAYIYWKMKLERTVKNEIVIETSTVIMLFAKSNGITWIEYKYEMTCILI